MKSADGNMDILVADLIDIKKESVAQLGESTVKGETLLCRKNYAVHGSVISDDGFRVHKGSSGEYFIRPHLE
jgi:hypothetical protein